MTRNQNEPFRSDTDDAKAADNKCPRCENRFVCDIAQGRDHCWCMNVPAALPLCADAQCLCPDCLAKAIRGINSTSTVTYGHDSAKSCASENRDSSQVDEAKN